MKIQEDNIDFKELKLPAFELHKKISDIGKIYFAKEIEECF